MKILLTGYFKFDPCNIQYFDCFPCVHLHCIMILLSKHPPILHKGNQLLLSIYNVSIIFDTMLTQAENVLEIKSF